jgi:hypothetical protein
LKEQIDQTPRFFNMLLTAKTANTGRPPLYRFCILFLLGGKYVWFLVSQEILTKKAGVSVLFGQETLTKTFFYSENSGVHGQMAVQVKQGETNWIKE